MPEASPSCVTTAGQRAMRGLLSVLTGAVAYGAATSGRLWCAVPAAVCSAFLAIGAITGWCPTNLLRGRHASARLVTTHGYPDASHLLRLPTHPSREGTGA